MPFGSYKSLSDVANAYQITGTPGPFVYPAQAPVNDLLRSELDFALREVGFTNSEFSACENFIYPVLKDVWKSYLEILMLWSHEPLYFDDDLSGTPDYFVSKRPPLGTLVRGGLPYVLEEAKRDKFEESWGLCLAAMLAAQKLNQAPEQVVYGIVSNGRTWEFGQLQGTTFTLDGRPFSLADLELLLGALHFVFTQCKHLVLGQPCLA
jgi:hypothetical protein